MATERQPQMKLADFFGLRSKPIRPRFRSWELHVTKPGVDGEPNERYTESHARKIDAEASKARLVHDGYTVIGPVGSVRSC